MHGRQLHAELREWPNELFGHVPGYGDRYGALWGLWQCMCGRSGVQQWGVHADLRGGPDRVFGQLPRYANGRQLLRVVHDGVRHRSGL